ncbi:hypothetical protein B0H67DRAFT_585342 [Lasiosphaeris hirsuta]|uniref:HMG box domain-containing protein n=1 Tax=Lasiosphaeris hirsuta TaxID=260670 RepID=A0AA40A8Z0_9PEZI|nr:hypothetical protein B0H67DRAFT_585342 [Lasiosphaeris hirsuta]
MAPATSTPPALPPSVEEAYRRKCIQLKQRTNEVEEANDAARLRLTRLKRQVEKMRLERAFLLEQLAKRTSANVEDSDGSPSPPPTVSSPAPTASFPSTTIIPANSEPRKLNSTTPQPKEKPLRIKRGHRKPSMLTSFDTPSAGGTGGGSVSGGGGGVPGGGVTFTGSQNLRTQSPSSDAFSAQHLEGGGRANGVHRQAPRKPGSAFDLYCDETRDSLKDKSKDDESAEGAGGSGGVEEELARSWKDLATSRREEFETRADDEMAKYQKEKDAYDAKSAAKAAAKSARDAERDAENDANSGATEEVDENGDGDRDARAVSSVVAGGSVGSPQQEDVEMGNYDTDQETQGEKPEE